MPPSRRSGGDRDVASPAVATEDEGANEVEVAEFAEMDQDDQVGTYEMLLHRSRDLARSRDGSLHRAEVARSEMIRARGERDLAERDSRDARDELSHVREKLEKSLRGDLLERSEKEQELAQICARLTESLSECAQKKEKAEKDAREYHAELQELKSALPEGAFASPMMQANRTAGAEDAKRSLFGSGTFGNRIIPGSTIAAKARTHIPRANPFLSRVEAAWKTKLTNAELEQPESEIRRDLIRGRAIGAHDESISGLEVPNQKTLVPSIFLTKLFEGLLGCQCACLAAEAGDMVEFAKVNGNAEDMVVYNKRKFAVLDLYVGGLMYKAVEAGEHVGLKLAFHSFSETGGNSRKFTELFKLILNELKKTAVGAECERVKRSISYRKAEGTSDLDVAVKVLGMLPEMKTATVTLEDLFVLNSVSNLSGEVVRLLPELMRMVGTGEVGFVWCEEVMKQFINLSTCRKCKSCKCTFLVAKGLARAKPTMGRKL